MLLRSATLILKLNLERERERKEKKRKKEKRRGRCDSGDVQFKGDDCGLWKMCTNFLQKNTRHLDIRHY